MDHLDKKKISIVIIMENTTFHKGSVMNNVVQLIYMYPYSPFFNPIENNFGTGSKLGGNCRNDIEIVKGNQFFYWTISPQHCSNYFRHVKDKVKDWMSVSPISL